MASRPRSAGCAQKARILNLMQTFGELFIESKGAPINYDGNLVHAIYTRQIIPLTTVRTKRLNCSTIVPQGLMLTVSKGQLECSGQKSKKFVLWSNTGPVEDRITYLGRNSTTLKIWNVWMNARTMNAWIGYGGMLIDDSGSSVVFSCSDGVGEPDFSDLIMRVDFDPPSNI